MKHIIIQVESILFYPPTLSLIQCLKRRGDNVVLLTACKDRNIVDLCEKKEIQLVITRNKYSADAHVIKKFYSMLIIRQNIGCEIKSQYADNCLIWIMTSISLKHVGNWIYGKKYIMYMYELSDKIKYYNKLPFARVNLKRMFDNASAIIECEYNRAHILRSWFGIKNIPYVVPNKALLEEGMKCHSFISNEYARQKINAITDKKIILYQGIIDKERPLKPMIDAIHLLDDSYVLLIMSADIEKLREYESAKVCLIPFINPPSHLEVTSWAHIGILIYSAVLANGTTSPLNSIYCAPNKLYEYSMFGIPMLGNDIPGLKYTIEYNNMGVCFKSMEPEEIAMCIKRIETNYDTYKMNSKNFYEQTDTEAEINAVVDDFCRKNKISDMDK